MRMDERDWRIPIEPRTKSKVTPYAHTPTEAIQFDLLMASESCRLSALVVFS
jgi:hypothetical protein